ncbi:MAG: MaoC family dehydratase [Alphaproteobacteria bacterium]|nr:MaoC family dehydratase [Alphaproteobacteria bacterium]
MSGLYLEDFHVGRKFTTEPVSLSEGEIVAFAQKYDPQPIHVDPAAAEKSTYGGLIASGFQTISVGAGQWLRTGLQEGTGMGGPGLRDIRWLAPVRPGDMLHTTVEVAEARPSRSKPDRGIVRFAYTMRTDAEIVATFSAIILLRCRPDAG